MLFRKAARALSLIVEAEDAKVIAVGIVVVLVVGLPLILLGLFAGLAVGVFEALGSI